MAKLNKTKTDDQFLVDESVATVEVEESTPTDDTVVVDTENPNPNVQVDTSIDIDERNIPEVKEQNVRIRMAKDHHCVIAMERYDLLKGQCYIVSPNVKRILNEAGLLAPL